METPLKATVFNAIRIRNIEAQRTPGQALDWNRLSHDHAAEIASGRVQVLGLHPREVVDLVATAHGIIDSFQFDGNIPNGKVMMAQAAGRPLTATEYAQSTKEALTGNAPR